MGAFEQAVEQVVRKYAENLQIKQTLSGVAKDVTDTTCTVVRENAPELFGVRLNAIDDDLKSFVTIIPATGSNVLVGIIENLKTEAIVLRCSEVEKVIMKIGSNTLTFDKNGFVFNDGKNKGIVKVLEMVNWMNNAYSDFQTLSTMLKTHTVAGNGAALGLVFTPSTPEPQQSTFEDTKIKH